MSVNAIWYRRMRKLLLICFSVVVLVAFGAYVSRVLGDRSLPRSGLLIVLAPGTPIRAGSNLVVRVNGAVVANISDLYERKRRYVQLPPDKHLAIVFDERTDLDEDGIKNRVLSRFRVDQVPGETLLVVRMAEIPRMVVYDQRWLACIRQIRQDIGPPDYGIIIENSSNDLLRRVTVNYLRGTLVESDVLPGAWRDLRYNAVMMTGVEKVDVTLEYANGQEYRIRFPGMLYTPKARWWPRRWDIHVVDSEGILQR